MSSHLFVLLEVADERFLEGVAGLGWGGFTKVVISETKKNGPTSAEIKSRYGLRKWSRGGKRRGMGVNGAGGRVL